MRLTTKGQVTIPVDVREKYGFQPHMEVDFIEEGGRVYLVKKKHLVGESTPHKRSRFASVRGIATVKMTTDEIMQLMRK